MQSGIRGSERFRSVPLLGIGSDRVVKGRHDLGQSRNREQGAQFLIRLAPFRARLSSADPKLWQRKHTWCLTTVQRCSSSPSHRQIRV